MIKKYFTFFAILLSFTHYLKGQDPFYNLYFINEQLATENWINWDMIQKNKVKTLEIFILNSENSLKKDTAYLIKRTYDITGKLTSIYQEDIINRYNSNPEFYKHKTIINYNEDGLIKSTTSNFYEVEKTSNPLIDVVNKGAIVIEYYYTKDSLGRIIEQITNDIRNRKTTKKTIRYNNKNEISEMKEYYCTNCYRDKNLMNNYEKVNDNYLEGKHTIIQFNSEGKKSMQFYMDSPGLCDTVFTRFTYDLLKNIERKETFLKRFHIAEIMTEVPQSTFSILYNKQNLISELRDEKNGVCYTYLYDAHNKLIKIIGCKENSAFDGVYNFVYTFYK